MQTSEWGKRLLLGRKLRSDQERAARLRKRVAVPVFASNALSSLAYAPDEIFIMLAVGGVAAYAWSLPAGIAVAVIMVVVVASYRQSLRAYRSGGDYRIAMTNLGEPAGLIVAGALLVDYSLTVAVSLSAAAQYAASVVESLHGHQTLVAVALALVIMTMNLRGLREAGPLFALPTYLFIGMLAVMVLWGFARYLFGDLPRAASAHLTVVPEDQYAAGLSGLALAFLVLRALSSGSAALTGVEVVSNGVSAFRKPRGRNARITLTWIGLLSVVGMVSVIALANLMGIRMVERPDRQLVGPDGAPVGADFQLDPVVSQLAAGIFDNVPVGFYLVVIATGVVLLLAANTAFNGFALLASVLGGDGYLPKQLRTRGDRLAYSNGIMVLAGFAIVLIVVFGAGVTQLIQLYLVGVFCSFTLSQAGMVRHWAKARAAESDPAVRTRMRRSQVINATGCLVTGLVLLVVLVTKFVHGAWITVATIAGLFALMVGIRRHYRRVAGELTVGPRGQYTHPSRVHAIVLVSKLHKPALRALAYAGTTRPDVLEAVTVDVDPAETKQLLDDWDRMEIPVPLRVLASPYREITRPILDYVGSIKRASPRDLVMVYVPEYIVGHWWERLLHTRVAAQLRSRLTLQPGVMVTSVPYRPSSAVGSTAPTR